MATMKDDVDPREPMSAGPASLVGSYGDPVRAPWTASWRKFVRAAAIVLSGAALVLAFVPAGLFSVRVDGPDECAKSIVSVDARSSRGRVELVVGTPLGTLRLTLH